MSNETKNIIKIGQSMKSLKNLFLFFKKKEPAKIQPKERKDHSLERFVDAQERVYERALADEKTLAVLDKLDVKFLRGAIAGDIIGSKYDFFT